MCNLEVVVKDVDKLRSLGVEHQKISMLKEKKKVWLAFCFAAPHRCTLASEVQCVLWIKIPCEGADKEVAISKRRYQRTR